MTLQDMPRILLLRDIEFECRFGLHNDLQQPVDEELSVSPLSSDSVTNCGRNERLGCPRRNPNQ